MDVDLLRPGTVPIAPDAVLWFEFLLNPLLLEEHLSKPFADPSASDLILKFVSLGSETKDSNSDIKVIENDVNEPKPNGQNKVQNKHFRYMALKILALKVAAYLKWDLEFIQKKLPIIVQATLFQDLFYFTTDSVLEVPNVPEVSPSTASSHLLFALVLYHRWVIHTNVCKILNNKPLKQTLSHNLGAPEISLISSELNEDFLRKIELQLLKSVDFLNEVLKTDDLKPIILIGETFQVLTEDTTKIEQNWDKAKTISIEEFHCQIHYDLGVYCILKEDYKNAAEHISLAQSLYNNLDHSKPFYYCRIKKDDLNGYCVACKINVEGRKLNLTQGLLDSIRDQYSNILQILQADNITREIPEIYRDNLELDIQGGLANKKIFVAGDLLLKIQCLNLVRKVLTNQSLIGDYVFQIKSAGPKGLDILFWAFDGVLKEASATDKRRIAQYFLSLTLQGEIENLPTRILNDPNYTSLYDKNELFELRREAFADKVILPDLLLNNDWGIEAVNFLEKSKIHLFNLEQKLITTYDLQEIRNILDEISRLDIKRFSSVWQINHSWEIPIPLQSVIVSLPDGFIKHYTYILVAKSKELVILQVYDLAKKLLEAAESEVQNLTYNKGDSSKHSSGNNLLLKLLKLLHWEILLIDISYCLYAWPATNIYDIKYLTIRAKQCLATLQSTDQLLPRQEIIEYCAVFLLNVCEWDYLTSLEKQLGCFEFIAALSNTAKHKDSQKFPKEAWEIMLAACKPNRDQPQKRNNPNIGGISGNISRETLISITSIFSRLRDVTILTIAISLLARIHNIMRDETNLELYTSYLNYWPSTIASQKSYNLRITGEYLFQLLTQALKYYPTNVQWLRTMGDLNFVLGYYESAMKFYLEAVIVVSDFFTAPARPPIDDFVWRRMIKCCAHLQCYTQAVVLCQFLDEVDYALAFKMAGNEQKNSAPADAMDAYYHCIWDTTILEYLINLHSKRGEHHRKQLVIRIIGQLELNSNNNEEIQREAANVRKSRFLRALAKQYVL